MQSDYTALLHRILRALAQADAPTIDNVMACIYCAHDQAREFRWISGRPYLDRAAQHLWGSYPPEGIRVDDHWHYSVTA